MCICVHLCACCSVIISFSLVAFGSVQFNLVQSGFRDHPSERPDTNGARSPSGDEAVPMMTTDKVPPTCGLLSYFERKLKNVTCSKRWQSLINILSNDMTNSVFWTCDSFR